MSRDLDNAFNDCLERMSSGEDIQQCVGRYPKYREELLPLLQTAMATEQVASEATYRADAKARGLSRLMEALNDRGVPRKRGVSFFFLRPLARPVAMGLGALLLVGFAAGGTAVASSNSVPGDTLYWVKTARENISLRFPQSDMERAQAHAVLAHERGEEMRSLVAKGKLVSAERVARRMGRHLNKSANYSGVFFTGNPNETVVRPMSMRRMPRAMALQAMLQRDGGALRAELTQLIKQMPPGRQRRVQRMMHRSDLRYRILIDALNANRSSQRLPFWRIDPSGSASR